MNSKEIKKKLLLACQQDIEKKIKTIEERLKAIKDSRDNETKSSVGDKYETGRAMMQMEENNIKKQLSQIIRTQEQLSKINIQKMAESIEPGSLVITSNGNYFISVGLGEVEVDDEKFFCISIQSPVGNHLRGKRKGDEIDFGGKVISIQEVN